MSAREWKPGDVAMRRGPNGVEEFAVYVTGCYRHGDGSPHWHTVTKNGYPDWDTLTYDGVTYRPLVVIDPEDREQVERLWEFADSKPPRPPEPMGKWAIVFDGTRVYCRAAWASDTPWNPLGTSDWLTYDEIQNVQIRHEGLTS